MNTMSNVEKNTGRSCGQCMVCTNLGDYQTFYEKLQGHKFAKDAGSISYGSEQVPSVL